MPSSSNSLHEVNSSLTQAERSALSDRAMLDAAVELVLEHGTEKTTLASIGKRAGYSRGLATYRFGSKAGLYDALCKSISHNWLEYLQRGVGDKVGIDAMCAALDSNYKFVSESPEQGCVLQILHCDGASPGSESSETTISIHSRQQSDVAKWVRQGQEAGQIRTDVDPQSVAAQYVAYITGMKFLWLISPQDFNFQNANAEMKRHLRKSLAASGEQHE